MWVYYPNCTGDETCWKTGSSLWFRRLFLHFCQNVNKAWHLPTSCLQNNSKKPTPRRSPSEATLSSASSLLWILKPCMVRLSSALHRGHPLFTRPPLRLVTDPGWDLSGITDSSLSDWLTDSQSASSRKWNGPRFNLENTEASWLSFRAPLKLKDVCSPPG